jgi:predicted  nucleic acid-binding Zn-ribbon protein
MSQTFKLFRLQQIDNQIEKVRSRLNEIEIMLADDSQVRLAQEKLETEKIVRDEAARFLRQAEQNVEAQHLKIEHTESALYGGKVRNPKELQDLQNESEALKRYLNVLEDRQLEAMIALDDAEARFQVSSEALSEITNQFTQQSEKLNKEKEILFQDLQRQESERLAAASNIQSEDLTFYETLRVKKSGLAVSRVVDRTCSACGSTLSSSLYSEAQLPSIISHCSTCGRILYVG